jgi:3-oxoacyl-[acyl-carrier protein] reductase
VNLRNTVVITGGTRGLGRETALAFGRAGYFVLALYSSDAKAACELELSLDEIKASGAVVQHDVCSDDPAVWNRPEIQEADRLTLVHGACAAFSPVAMHQLGWRDFESSFLVAVKGAWHCSHSLVPLMLRKKGCAIVSILTSAAGGNPPKGFAAYVTAKHALRGFNLVLAAEYAARGLKIFAVAPGYMETSLTQKWDSRLRDLVRANSDRITVPADAARRIVELVEDNGVSGHGETYPI